MSTRVYAAQHKILGLCRNCPKKLALGNKNFCEFHRGLERIRGRKKSKEEILKLKSECIEHYGNKCKCCGESIVQFLTIDHEGGKGNDHRRSLFGYNVGGVHMYRWLRKNGFPSGYRILCMNCNWGTRYSSICPHRI